MRRAEQKKAKIRRETRAIDRWREGKRRERREGYGNREREGKKKRREEITAEQCKGEKINETYSWMYG